jgi:hypothetical protein
MPVSGATAVVRHSNDPQHVIQDEVDDPVGEPIESGPANLVRTRALDQARSARPVSSVVDDPLHLDQELGAGTGPLALVPAFCGVQFIEGCWVETDPERHRLNCLRTSS